MFSVFVLIYCLIFTLILNGIISVMISYKTELSLRETKRTKGIILNPFKHYFFFHEKKFDRLKSIKLFDLVVLMPGIYICQFFIIITKKNQEPMPQRRYKRMKDKYEDN